MQLLRYFLVALIFILTVDSASSKNNVACSTASIQYAMATPTTYFDFLNLLTQQEFFSRKLAAELVASDQDGPAFFEKHYGKYFSNRGIDEPGNKEQTLCYLLDVLGEHGFVYELDWKADVDELNYALDQMSKGKIKDLLHEEDEEDAEGMFELIFTAEDRLKPLGWGLIQFPLDSDSHPIALAPLEHLPALNQYISDLFD